MGEKTNPLKPAELMRSFLENATPRELADWVDAGLRHKSGKQPADYLQHWLSVARHFGYATRDDSWGEFEKEFSIIITRLVVAERNLERLRSHPLLPQEPIALRCGWCGAEEPTEADRFLCREASCILRPSHD